MVRSWILALTMMALVGCVGARRRVQGDMVSSVRFTAEGSHGQGLNGSDLRAQMVQGASAFGARIPGLNSFVAADAFDRTALQDDGWRLEIFYAHNGFFDAQVRGWEVVRLAEPAGERAGVVRVVGHVDAGQRSLVRNVRVDWGDPDALSSTQRRWMKLSERTLARNASTRPDAGFLLDSVELDRAWIEADVQNHGHAYAAVDFSVDAHPEEHAVDVMFRVEPGITTRIGPITVQGDKAVSEELIRLTAVSLVEGSTFKLDRLRAAQIDLFKLGAFSMVSIEPDLSDPTRVDVPVRIKVVESKFQSIRFGAGLITDLQYITPRLTFSYRHINVGRKLIRFEAGGNVGMGINTAPLDATFVWGLNAGLTYPRIIGQRFDLILNSEAQADLLSGQLPFLRVGTGVKLAYRATDNIVFAFGPQVEWYNLEDFAGDEDKQNLVIATFGEGFETPYLLTLLEMSLTVDWRGHDIGQNPALSPRRGTFFQLGVRQAVPLGSDFLFTDLTGDARFYKNFRLRRVDNKLNEVISLRIKGKLVQPWILKESDGTPIDYKLQIPYAERAFLGGTNDMRGFRINSVGAYDCVCQPNPTHTQGGGIFSPDRRNDTYKSRQNPTYLPRGGRISTMLSAEWRHLRFPGMEALTFPVFFGDIGVLVDDWQDFANIARKVRWDAGIGLRYETPIGPIRLDFTVRPTYPEDRPPLWLDDDAPDDPTQGRYYGCEAADGYAPIIDRDPKRGFGLNTYRWGSVDRGKDGLPPVAFGITIAIGEAF